jgi:preprotein translocase subunit SecA
VDLQEGQRPAALRYSAPGEDGHVVETEPQRTVERQADRRGKKVKRKRR